MSSIVWCDNTVGKVFGETLTKMSNVTFASFQISFTRELVIFTWEQKNVTVKTKKSHLRDLFHTWRASFSMKCKCPCLLEFPHVETKHGTWSVKVWAWTSTRWYKVNRTFSHVIGFFSHFWRKCPSARFKSFNVNHIYWCVIGCFHVEKI